MKPYIISHMMESVDGRIDCDMTEQIDPTDSYYEALDKLGCPSLLMGRVTMQMHYADSTPFSSPDKTPIGHEAVHKAETADGYIIGIDTHGKLRWHQNRFDGKPLLVITSESCQQSYLQTLSGQNISWIAAGKTKIDLPRAVELLSSEFGIKRLAVVGGGHINGAFLEANLLDEVSVMIGPGIDGRKGMASVFDGIDDKSRPATLLKLESFEKIGEGTLWLRYTFKG